MSLIGRRCEAYNHLGTAAFEWCVSLNANVTQVEAMVTVPILSTRFVWRCDYIRLLRRVSPGSTEYRVRWAGPTGWMNGTDNSMSTSWWDHGYNPGYFRATAKIRFAFNGGYVGPWSNNGSSTINSSRF